MKQAAENSEKIIVKPGIKKIWTIGHSTRSIDDFLALLQSFEIELLVDVRSFPGSRKFPHFNQEVLAESLSEQSIGYRHLKKLGGRRKVNPDSKNTIWRNESFRAYADYMETAAFDEGLEELEKLAADKRTAIMCSEAVWWRCHRSMISDMLKVRGWEVQHIMDVDKADEHPYTGPAKVVENELVYGAEETSK